MRFRWVLPSLPKSHLLLSGSPRREATPATEKCSASGLMSFLWSVCRGNFKNLRVLLEDLALQNQKQISIKLVCYLSPASAYNLWSSDKRWNIVVIWRVFDVVNYISSKGSKSTLPSRNWGTTCKDSGPCTGCNYRPCCILANRRLQKSTMNSISREVILIISKVCSSCERLPNTATQWTTPPKNICYKHPQSCIKLARSKNLLEPNEWQTSCQSLRWCQPVPNLPCRRAIFVGLLLMASEKCQ